MDINHIRWTYAIALAGPAKGLEVEYSIGPIKLGRMLEILGGEFEVQPLRDGTAIAYLRYQDPALEENEHYPGIRGPILVGKVSDGTFLGAIGIAI